MLQNRSIPTCTVIPVLSYPDVSAAVEWLCATFGFTLRLRIGNHRAQLNVADGALVIAEGLVSGCDAVMVRVADVDSHHARALKHGARIINAPAEEPYGEKQYSVEDFGGRRWTFSQSVADVAPQDWGGEVGRL